MHDDTAAQLRDEADVLRKELERRQAESQLREDTYAAQVAELRRALSSAETRRLNALVESDKQLSILRHQITGLRNQVSNERREARERSFGQSAADTLNSPRAAARLAGMFAGGSGRPRASSLLGGERAGEFDDLVSQISERLAKRGISAYDAHDATHGGIGADGGGGGGGGRGGATLSDEYVASQMQALAARQHSVPLAGQKPMPPRAPMNPGGASAREMHARLTQLEPNHSALVQLKDSVRQHANRSRRPVIEVPARVGLDPAAGSRRKTIATLRTRLDRAKTGAAA
jgi:hypothetical protein